MDTQFKRLKYLLKEEGLTQKKLCELVGLSTNYMSQLMTGKQILSRRLALSIQGAIGYSAVWLLTGEGEPKIPSHQVDMFRTLNNQEELKTPKKESIDQDKRNLETIMYLKDEIEKLSKYYKERQQQISNIDLPKKLYDRLHEAANRKELEVDELALLMIQKGLEEIESFE